MATYGLTNEGFLVKTLDVIRSDISIALQAVFGPSIRLDDQSILGQLVGIIAERMALLWELAEAVNSSQDPDAATGAALEQLCLLTGTLRPPATYSAVQLTLTGDPGTVIPSGTKVKTTSTLLEFSTSNGALLVALAAWVASTPYVVDDRVTVNGHVYQCVTAGTSDVGTGPDSEPPDFLNPAATPQARNAIVDGTVVWVYLGEGTAVDDVVAQATDSGPVTAVAYDISTIVNAISGWDSVTNLADANTGRNIATDSELRLLREQELATGGSSPINALRAELLRVTGVLVASIFVNNTDFVDADGVPAHSIEALVRGPETPDAVFDQNIWDALLAGVAAGIRTYANPAGNPVVGTATDDEGNVHAMSFSRPVNRTIYVDLLLVKDPALYPTDGDDQIKLAIVTWGDLQNTGKNVVANALIAQAFKIPGVLDVTHCWIDDAPVPTVSTTIPVSLRELAVYDTSNIAVASVDGVP